MKIVLVLAALVAVSVAAPQGFVSTPIPVLQFDDSRDEFGQFALTYRTGNGISVTREGSLKATADGKDHVLIQSGSQTYESPNGEKITETWTADENGYIVEGDHIPKASNA
ncbi:endocuticle structural glycoprotein SgAbd-2-like [Neodiprion fabricii]|uniref:endocuticle structural glycoprotein SgAbd-2-like n=1 Tax=Neodiprion fabricii TaxID=2872261 RepID=UPI001ED8E419|nr:endocuticle structural glycoprotein SgAbd-2-like [Neodiprion fabricii]